jgi:hypothetical protein
VISFALPSVSTKAGTVGVRGLRSSEVVYKDGGGFNEGCDGFFLDHCIVWENGFRKTHDHGFRESVVLHESAGTCGGLDIDGGCVFYMGGLCCRVLGGGVWTGI